MKTVSFEVYTLAELKALGNQRAVERAMDWLREGAADYEWWDYYEMWQSALHQIGFENAKIAFSGFSSQGDGASFTADVDLEKLATFMGTPVEPKDRVEATSNGEEDFRHYIVEKCHGVAFDKRFLRMKWLENSSCFSVKRTSSHYCHSYTCTLEAELYDNGHGDLEVTKTGEWLWNTSVPHVEKLFNDFVEAVEQLRKNLCGAIYSSLGKEYDYLVSDEVLEENAETNGYTFTAEGRRMG